ncbi:TRAP transporter substrate-binding protein DctP [Virgibacillus sp. W0181]|uniref:TRAP transporter substrate-binding protein DctP n=1 Tax=Virgibacillus sp. W0181 TaxID=3391581 RepID=UPI003F48C54E
MINKNILTIVSSILLIIFITGCTNDQKSNGNGNDTSVESIELKIGTTEPLEDPITQSMVEFTEKVEERTDGRIKFSIFPSSELGDYELMYEEMSKGTLDAGLLAIPPTFDPRSQVLMMPYLVETYDQVPEMFGTDSYLYKLTEKIVNDQNIHLLGLRPIGFGATGSTKEVKNPADFESDKNLLIRIPDSKIFDSLGTNMGFNTTSVPWADLYTAIQTGTVDAALGGQPSTYYNSFRDVIKYYYQFNYNFEAMPLLISKEIWEEISEEDRNILEEEGLAFTDNSIKNAKEIDEEYREKLRDEGIEVVEFTDEELHVFGEYIRKKVWPQIKDEVGEEVIENLLKEIN